MPWRFPWAWEGRIKEKQAVEAAFLRELSDPLLAGAVRFDPPGANMEEWFRDVGFMLSSSDTEGCHTAVMEGMASGAMPIVRDWPGARELYGENVWAKLDDAIPGVIAHAQAPDWEARCAELSNRASIWDIEPFTTAILEVLFEGAEVARQTTISPCTAALPV